MTNRRTSDGRRERPRHSRVSSFGERLAVHQRSHRPACGRRRSTSTRAVVSSRHGMTGTGCIFILSPCSSRFSKVDSKQKPPSISAVWCPWCHVGLRWAYGETEVRKITGRGAPIFSACWFRSTAPGFRNWHLPVHMGLLAHPRPCHRLAVPAAPHEPCTRGLLFSRSSHAQC